MINLIRGGYHKKKKKKTRKKTIKRQKRKEGMGNRKKHVSWIPNVITVDGASAKGVG